MLRTKSDHSSIPDLVSAATTPPEDDNAIPDLRRPYATGEQPVGILFYLPKESFWHPYHLLQWMEFQSDELKLVLTSEDVIIRGRKLHPLYVGLARQTVCRVIEQGERYAALSPEGTLVTQIRRQPHTADTEQP